MSEPRLRIAVTGAAGQVARSLAERASIRGVDVILVGRPDLDLAQEATVLPALRTARPDAIVNAAAYTAVDKAEEDEAAAFAVNAEGAGHVARAARGLGVPLVHLSTDYVYDGSGDAPWRESDPTHPLSAYGRTKKAGEDAVRDNAQRHVILRTSWVYSPFGQNFVRTMLRLAQTRDELRVVSDQVGSPTYAPDLADAILTVCANLVAGPQDPGRHGTFHCAGGGHASWAEVAQAIFARAAELGGPTARVVAIPSSEYPTPARRPLNSRLDTAKLRRSHGVELPDWRDGISRCVTRLLAADEHRGL